MGNQVQIPDLPVVFRYNRGYAGVAVFGMAVISTPILAAIFLGGHTFLAGIGPWGCGIGALVWMLLLYGTLYLFRARVVFTTEQVWVRGVWRWTSYPCQTLTGAVRKRRYSYHRNYYHSDFFRMVCLEREGRIVADLSKMVIPGSSHPASLRIAMALVETLCPVRRCF